MSQTMLYGVVLLAAMAVAVELDSGSPFVTYDGVPFHKIILVAPHGGNEKPDSILDRHDGCLNTEDVCQYVHGCGERSTNCRVRTLREVRTKEIVQVVQNELMERRGWFAYRIVSELHRSKMDPSRNFSEATFNDPTAADAYQRFHDSIWQATEQVHRGLMVVFHGVSASSHPEERIELGYRMDGNSLDGPIIENPSKSSFWALLKEQCIDPMNYTCTNAVIRGPNSLGQILVRKMSVLSIENRREVVPSENVTGPGGAPYFWSGFVANMYGSHYGNSTIDVLHLEIPKILREKSTYELFGKALADAFVDFMDMYYRDN